MTPPEMLCANELERAQVLRINSNSDVPVLEVWTAEHTNIQMDPTNKCFRTKSVAAQADLITVTRDAVLGYMPDVSPCPFDDKDGIVIKNVVFFQPHLAKGSMMYHRKRHSVSNPDETQNLIDTSTTDTLRERVTAGSI